MKASPRLTRACEVSILSFVTRRWLVNHQSKDPPLCCLLLLPCGASSNTVESTALYSVCSLCTIAPALGFIVIDYVLDWVRATLHTWWLPSALHAATTLPSDGRVKNSSPVPPEVLILKKASPYRVGVHFSKKASPLERYIGLGCIFSEKKKVQNQYLCVLHTLHLIQIVAYKRSIRAYVAR